MDFKETDFWELWKVESRKWTEKREGRRSHCYTEFGHKIKEKNLAGDAWMDMDFLNKGAIRAYVEVVEWKVSKWRRLRKLI